MKQHITEKQLNELTIEQSAKLMYSFGNDDLVGGEDVTIGKMIEILRNELECFDMTSHNDLHIGYIVSTFYKNGKYSPTMIYKSPTWQIIEHTKEENDKYRDVVYCDTLWEAVKHVIEEEK